MCDYNTSVCNMTGEEYCLYLAATASINCQDVESYHSYKVAETSLNRDIYNKGYCSIILFNY